MCLLERNRIPPDSVATFVKKFRRIMSLALLAGVLSFLIVPLLITESTSGVMTYREAAGDGAEFVQAGGVDVHLQVAQFAGQATAEEPPLLILMHGFGASTYSWREVIEPLADYGDVIAYDRPGFGFTERPDSWQGVNPYGFEGNFQILDDLIAKFGEGREVVLIGHSAGGQLAAEYSRLRPDRVSSLVLVDPAILTTGGAPEWLGWLWDVPQIDKLGPVLVSGIANSGEQILEQSFFDPELITPEVRAGYRAPLKVEGWERGFWNFVSAPRANALKENLDSLTLPTLIITGDTDTIVPTEDSIQLNELLPNARLEVIEKSGHLPHEEKSVDFMRAVGQNAAWLFGG